MDDRRHNTTLDEPSCTAQTMTTESESMTREEEGSPDTGDSGLCSLINNVGVLDVIQTLFLFSFFFFSFWDCRG